MLMSKKYRQEYAKDWYNLCKFTKQKLIAIIIQRNPYNRDAVYFLGRSLSGYSIIAESPNGVEDCFADLISSLTEEKGPSLVSAQINTWLENKLGVHIIYKDDYVIMLEKQKKSAKRKKLE